MQDPRPAAQPAVETAGARLTVERAVALLITAIAAYVFVNGAVFSVWNAVHIDFSINWVASHALLHGADMYGRTTLLERAASLGSPTNLVYSQLYTSYIQPPTSAFLITPFTALSWRDATHLMLVINNLALLASVALTLLTVKPELALRWTIAGAAVITAFFSQIYTSFALDQWDAVLVLLLSIGFWASLKRKDPLAGVAIGLAAAIKLIPGLLLLYFLWRGRATITIWGAGAGLVLVLASFALAGPNNYNEYFTSTLPALLKGSSNYTNSSIQAVLARADTPELNRGLPEVYSLDEVDRSDVGRALSTLATIAGVVAIAAVVGRGKSGSQAEPVEAQAMAYYFVVAIGLLISSVTWEFYTIWLLPVFLIGMLSYARALPSSVPLRALCLLALAIAYVGLSYPGDPTLIFPSNNIFAVDSALYNRDWIPGIWVENQLGLYRNHIDAVLLVRLPSLLLLTGTMTGLILWNRRVGADSE